MPLVDPTGAKQILDDPPEGLVVLDVRTPDEFDESHLHGATLIDFYGDEFVERLQELDPSVPYLVYCRSGGRSAKAAQLMGQLGFADVTDLGGGMLAWAEAGLPQEH